VIWVLLTTVITPVTFAVVPNFTVLAPVKFEPVIVTVVPPPAGPDVGEIAVITGVGADTVI
jgi:hypothetical protein